MKLRRFLGLLIVMVVASMALSTFVARGRIQTLRGRLDRIGVSLSFSNLTPKLYGAVYSGAVFRRAGLCDVYVRAPAATVLDKDDALSIEATGAEVYVFGHVYSVPSGTVERVRLVFQRNLVYFDGALVAPAFAIDHPLLHDRPVTWRNVDFAFSGRVDRAASTLTLDRATLRAGGATVVCSGTWSTGPAARPYDVSISTAGIRGDQMPGLLPVLLTKRLGRISFDGDCAFAISAHADATPTNRVRVTADVRNRLTVRGLSPAFDTEGLTSTFTWEILDAFGGGIRHESGPASRDWVPLSGAPPALTHAVVALVDPGFWMHRGISGDVLGTLMESYLGGAAPTAPTQTLTERLAANLWPGPDEGMTRDIELAVLATSIEATLSKSEILALFMNTAPAGHGIIGFADASLFYFNAKPGELSPRQSVLLALALANPGRPPLDDERRENPELEPVVEEQLGHLRDAGASDAPAQQAPPANRMP